MSVTKSVTNGNVWKPRQVEEVTCESGQVVRVKRPGPEFTLQAGRFIKTLPSDSDPGRQRMDGESEEDFEARFLLALSDSERAAMTEFARQLVCAMVVWPKLKMNPREGELGPDDIGGDLWFLFGYAMRHYYATARVADTEVEVSDLETFRGDASISGGGVDSLHVPPETQPDNADQGLVGIGSD